MTRYFYTDPLAAAWMARHFGMTFDAPIQPVIKYDGTPSMQITPKCFYLHVDSLRLLEPRVGDLVYTRAEMKMRRIDERKTGCDDYHLWRADHVWPQPFPDEDETVTMKIVQRDGKPFHWPESEAA